MTGVISEILTLAESGSIWVNAVAGNPRNSQRANIGNIKRDSLNYLELRKPIIQNYHTITDYSPFI